MNPLGLKIPKLYQGILFLTLALSWFSGLGFFILDTFFVVEGEFGLEKHPLQNPALTAHGAAAFLMTIWFGAALGGHVPYSWRTRRLRFLGLLLLGNVGLQIVTAYLLFYVGDLATRQIVIWVHLAGGLALPLSLFIHVRAAIKNRRNTAASRRRRYGSGSTRTAVPRRAARTRGSSFSARS